MRALATWITCVCLAGCSFPEIELVPEDAAQSGLDGALADTGEGDASTDGDDDANVGDGGDATIEDGSVDAQDATADTTSDGATDTKVDTGASDVAPCESGNPCDCDGDGDNKPGPGCGGGDCDDGDPRRNSKVTAHQSYAIAGTGHAGDWNCNGTVEREHGNGGVNCGGLALGPCAGTSGYKQASPTCGGSATHVTCKVQAGVLCVEGTTQTVTVKCK